jgi:hypothetical protein
MDAGGPPIRGSQRGSKPMSNGSRSHLIPGAAPCRFRVWHGECSRARHTAALWAAARRSRSGRLAQRETSSFVWSALRRPLSSLLFDRFGGPRLWAPPRGLASFLLLPLFFFCFRSFSSASALCFIFSCFVPVGWVGHELSRGASKEVGRAPCFCAPTIPNPPSRGRKGP